MPKGLLYLYFNYRFKKQMLQAANTDLFNPSFPKAHNNVKVYHSLYKLSQL